MEHIPNWQRMADAPTDLTAVEAGLRTEIRVDRASEHSRTSSPESRTALERRRLTCGRSGWSGGFWSLLDQPVGLTYKGCRTIRLQVIDSVDRDFGIRSAHKHKY